MEGEEEEVVKTVTSPARSPNRKLREATDKMSDRLRAYAQKFKEGKEKGKEVKQEKDNLVRSASAGRSDTIEEETFEDVEAERTGVVRAYSLNSKQAAKPFLQSHSSTDSTDVPTTPKSTPSRGKKKLSLKKCKAGEEAELRPGQKKVFRGHKRCVLGRPGGGEAGSPGEGLTPPEASPTLETVGFPEMFRQAILEVDQLTQQLGDEGRRGEEGDSSEGGEEKVVQHKSRPGSKRRRKKEKEAAELRVVEQGLATRALSPAARSASYSALEVESAEREGGRGRLCISTSPSPSMVGEEARLHGSSTLPRPSKTALQPPLLPPASPPSVLSLQLEGAYGRACSVREGESGARAASEGGGSLGVGAVSLGGSREDTVSPLVSLRTGERGSCSGGPGLSLLPRAGRAKYGGGGGGGGGGSVTGLCR